jgi:head-tail adaptor
MRPHFPTGRRDKFVTLQTSTSSATAEGDPAETVVDLAPPSVYAAIAPVPAGSQERGTAGTVDAATHLITIPYHPQVTTETQVVYQDPWDGRTHRYYVRSIANPEGAHVLLVLTVQEFANPATPAQRAD